MSWFLRSIEETTICFHKWKIPEPDSWKRERFEQAKKSEKNSATWHNLSHWHKYIVAIIPIKIMQMLV